MRTDISTAFSVFRCRLEKARADGDQDELRRLSMKKAAANQEAATDANE